MMPLGNYSAQCRLSMQQRQIWLMRCILVNCNPIQITRRFLWKVTSFCLYLYILSCTLLRDVKNCTVEPPKWKIIWFVLSGNNWCKHVTRIYLLADTYFIYGTCFRLPPTNLKSKSVKYFCLWEILAKGTANFVCSSNRVKPPNSSVNLLWSIF